MRTTIIMTMVLLLSSATMNAQDKAKAGSCDILTSAVCDMCKETMERELIYEKGIKKVELNVETKMLHVDYNPKKTDVDKIRSAINDLGYDADDSPATKEGYDSLHECCKKDSHP